MSYATPSHAPEEEERDVLRSQYRHPPTSS
jgi:hypothetical protein